MLKTASGKAVSKIGIGTWTINKENFKEEVSALKYYFNHGVNYIDVVLAYDNGRTLDVIAEFLKHIKREDIFINGFITYGCEKVEDIEKQIDLYLEKLGTDYLDCVTLHALGAIGFDFNKYVKKINSLKGQKFLREGYSNLPPKLLKKVAGSTDYFEGLYNLECKINEDSGVMEICRENKIPFYAYQPLRRNKTAKQNYPVLVSLAEKYGKTQNQILINWLVNHKKIGVLIKSSNKKHIQENLAALEFKMTLSDYKKLDQFRNKQFDEIEVCYTSEEGKVLIAALPNQPIGIL